MNSDIPTPFEHADDALEALETAWESGAPPDLAAFAARLRPDDQWPALCELIEIDMERRWKSGPEVRPLSVWQYLTQLNVSASESDLIALICCEYSIRNKWGDCVTRAGLFERNRHLGEPLLRALRDESRKIDWPNVAATNGGNNLLNAAFDRKIEVGRQHCGERGPWVIRTKFRRHRLVLGDYSNPEVSRNQLNLTLKTPASVLIRNTSQSRSVDLEKYGPLLPGEGVQLSLPIHITLKDSSQLRVTAAS